MIVNFKWAGNWPARSRRAPVPAPAAWLDRPDLAQLARPDAVLPPFVADCPLAQKYRTLLGALDWANFPERDAQHPWPGFPPLPRAPFVAAYLIKLDQRLRYMSDLRHFLVQHPALIWLAGFRLQPAATSPYGFDPEASLPTARLFMQVLRSLPNASLQFLLDSTVTCIRQLLPAEVNFGDTVVGDTKHILAWVRENNPKVFIKEGRFDKTRQPRADRDCRLGCKKKHNQQPARTEAGHTPPAAPTTPTTNPLPASTVEVGEYYWGYDSGIIATKVPGYGEFVLAELTQTFDRTDITYFLPLMAQVERRLGRKPRFGAFDAAFDAFYVYAYFHQAGGFAAVPFVERGGGQKRTFDHTGLPLCEAGLSMPLKNTFICRTSDVEHERGRFACPLLFPPVSGTAAGVQPTGQVCPIQQKNWAGGGCLTTMATSIGARLRHQLDRDSQAYKLLYNQRTASERINSLATDLGIERPRLRSRPAITNQNTMIYILLNLRGLQRVRAIQAGSAK
jgi:hypothetical protein